MQALNRTTPARAASQSQAGTSHTISPRLRRLFGHGFAAMTLTVAMLAQTLAAAPAASATTLAHATAAAASHADLSASALPSTGAPTQSLFFSPTGKTVRGDFLNTYQKFGLSRIGYPISEEKVENGTTVQYFERVRMEYHPELAGKGHSVLLTRLGAQISQGATFSRVASFVSTRSKAFFRETGHALSEPFLSYWKNNGGVELFGYPISESVMQDGYKVQWFERARMEYHTELARAGQTIQLTHLGRIALEKTGSKALPAAAHAPAAPAAPAPPAPAAPAAPPVQQAPAKTEPAAPPQVSLNEMEGYMLKAINDQRAAAGLGPVQINGAITDISRVRSNDMAERNYFSHTTPEGDKFLNMLGQRGVSYKFAGEILARNNYPSDKAAPTAMDSYLGSAPHKAIMLDGRFSLVGIGYAWSAEDEMNYFTVIFVQQ
jgi:uncharacterized protein YkwD